MTIHTAKRRRVVRTAGSSSRTQHVQIASFDTTLPLARGQHPYGVKPLGNLLLSAEERTSFGRKRIESLGEFSRFTDELILEILSYLDGYSLARAVCSSRFLYCFASAEEFWRSLVIEKTGGSFEYDTSWKRTFAAQNSSEKQSEQRDLTLGIASDILFRPWYCASVRISQTWLRTQNVDTVENTISSEEFLDRFEGKLRPVVIKGGARTWPAFQKWDRRYLEDVGGDTRFIAGEALISMKQYFKYAEQAREEKPLYIFDKKFADKCPRLGQDYSVPVYFQNDYFQLLGDKRPDFRWIILGPQRSGSSFHVDPNATSAWNALVRGRKKWIMFPPHVPPPGVHPSDDMGTVTSPVSLMEWFLSFYSSVKGMPEAIEFIQEEGDVVFVPSGWWHAVLNIEDTVAITQNYVSRSNLFDVLDFLRDKREQVSGCGKRGETLFEELCMVLEKTYPEVYSAYTSWSQEKENRRQAKKQKQSVWTSLVSEDGGDPSPSFTFGF